MTEQEAIKFLTGYLDSVVYKEKCVEAHKLAIKALEEIQKYRAIGTPEEFKNAMENVKTLSSMYEKLSDKEVTEYKELEEYRAIGTPNQIYIRMGGYIEELSKYAAIGAPDECRAAVEKQRAKKLIYDDYHRAGYRCPTCNNVNPWGYKHCKHCGQKLDWSDEE